MKKVYLALLAAGIFGMVACGGNKEEATTEAPVDSAATTEAAPVEATATPDTAAAATTEAAPAEAAH